MAVPTAGGWGCPGSGSAPALCHTTGTGAQSLLLSLRGWGCCSPRGRLHRGERMDGEAASRAGHDGGFVPSPACRRQGDGSGARPSAPSVLHSPTSIPQPLALILPPPHVGQRQKQSRDNPSVPPDPMQGTGLTARASGIAPARPGGATGVSPRAPAPHGSRGLHRQQQPRAPLGRSGLSCLVVQQHWGPPAHPPLSHHRCPTLGSAAQCRGSRGAQGDPWG